MMPTNLGLFITNGMTISIKSMGGSYICANPNNSVSLSPQSKDWETWTVEQVGNCYALKSYHNSYLRANPNKSVDLSPQIKSWELWNIVKYGVTFALRSNSFGTYLRVNQINLVDLAVQCKEWELWEIVEQKPQLNFLPSAPPLPLQMAQLYNPVPTRNFTQIQQQKFPSHNYYMMPQFASMNTNPNTIPQNHQQVFIPPIQTNQPNFNPFQEQKMFSSAFQPYQSFQQISIPQKTHPIQPKENPSLQNQPHFQMPPLQQQNRYQNIRLYNGRLITFKSFHGTFLSCDHLGNITVSPNCGEWERWTVEHHGNRYSFKSCHGTFLHADPNLTINMSYICDEWDKWTLEYINCNYYLLKSAHETYLRAEVNGSVTLSNFDGFYEQWIII